MSRPSSSCPYCQAPGRIDTDQVDRSPAHGQLRGDIRFACDCGASWRADAYEAHEHGDWLTQARLYHHLSPPAPEGVELPHPEHSRHSTRIKPQPARPPTYSTTQLGLKTIKRHAREQQNARPPGGG